MSTTRIHIPIYLLLLAAALCGPFHAQNAWAVTPLSGESVELEVAAWKTPCSYAEAYHGMCLVVRKAGETEWTHMPDTIKDFKYTWGHTYKIRILVHTPTITVTDSLGTKEFLTKIISDTPVTPGTTFDVMLDTTLEPLGWTALYSIDSPTSRAPIHRRSTFCLRSTPTTAKPLHAATSRTRPQCTTPPTKRPPPPSKPRVRISDLPTVPLQLTALVQMCDPDGPQGEVAVVEVACFRVRRPPHSSARGSRPRRRHWIAHKVGR